MVTEFVPGCFDAIANDIRGTGPVQITHLFRFREMAEYEDGRDLPSMSGRDAYLHRYIPAIEKIAKDHVPGGKLADVLYAGEFRGNIASPPNEQWDMIVIVTWPDFGHPYILDTCPDYETDAAPHRRAAIADFRVIATQPLDLGR